ncbi:hypothetical protein C1645_818723 [Glomus cerebriforme]|uniref:SAM domain-containing protein n=1 Tax=Glomus cerebriforme TaxID=658196 RepID=A0A397TG22_9GLOM|nr:hypothetical protein C1645_818723 [Glomus cerebriforme]
MEYLINTCLNCKKCLYCEDKLIKVTYSRISTPDLPFNQLEYIQESISQFDYSLDTNTKFKFTFCSACNSTFQRKKFTSISKNTTQKYNSKENNSVDDVLINKFEIIEPEEAKQIISFNLVIKLFNTTALPSKWVEIEASSLDDILADVYYFIKKLTSDDEIMHSDYLVTFKPEKVTGSGAQLVDMHDYKKFLLDYKKLSDENKNMTIIISLKKKEKKEKQSKRKRVLALDLEESESKNVDLHKKKNAILKMANFSEIIQQEGHMPNLPIFIQSSSVKKKSKTPSTPTNLNSNPILFFFAIPPQIVSFSQNSNIINSLNSPLSSPKQAVPSLDEFFIKLNESDNTGEFANFKKIFEDERISVNQIYNLTDAKFDQLGINKIDFITEKLDSIGLKSGE